MKSKKKDKKKVFVGLSGGVDSSVSAALLKERGFDVIGVFIKVWEPDITKNKFDTNITKTQCNWREERLDAMRVAAHLDIPFITMNLENEYKDKIVDYMINEYKSGRTPNPDVMCNKYIKFGIFFEKAIELGADFIATGHYSRVFESKDSKGTTKFQLLKGVDGNKDQSYFLWTLKQKHLKKTLFPVGGYEKLKVRKIARRFCLATATKKDSQGLCFVGKINMKEFLKEFISENKGNVLNEFGDIIGWHYGAPFYTIGQRHGFTITKKNINDSPYFVSEKDINKNTVTVSLKNKKGELPQNRTDIILQNINWISGDAPDVCKRYTARVRYRQALQCCHILFNGNKVSVVFEIPQIATSGQSLVIYDNEKCIGGGVIL